LGYEFDTPTSNILNEEERKTTNDDFICYFRRFPKLYFGGRTGQSPLFLDGQQVKKLHREFPTRKTKVKKTKVKKTKVKKTKVKRIKHFVQCSVFSELNFGGSLHFFCTIGNIGKIVSHWFKNPRH
jgi:hypothetical protein